MHELATQEPAPHRCLTTVRTRTLTLSLARPLRLLRRLPARVAPAVPPFVGRVMQNTLRRRLLKTRRRVNATNGLAGVRCHVVVAAAAAARVHRALLAPRLWHLRARAWRWSTVHAAT
eukprot:6201205-Pleurochrysis_carterae.AAC.1